MAKTYRNLSAITKLSNAKRKEVLSHMKLADLFELDDVKGLIAPKAIEAMKDRLHATDEVIANLNKIISAHKPNEEAEETAQVDIDEVINAIREENAEELEMLGVSYNDLLEVSQKDLTEAARKFDAMADLLGSVENERNLLQAEVERLNGELAYAQKFGGNVSSKGLEKAIETNNTGIQLAAATRDAILENLKQDNSIDGVLAVLSEIDKTLGSVAGEIVSRDSNARELRKQLKSNRYSYNREIDNLRNQLQAYQLEEKRDLEKNEVVRVAAEHAAELQEKYEKVLEELDQARIELRNKNNEIAAASKNEGSNALIEKCNQVIALVNKKTAEIRDLKLANENLKTQNKIYELQIDEADIENEELEDQVSKLTRSGKKKKVAIVALSVVLGITALTAGHFIGHDAMHHNDKSISIEYDNIKSELDTLKEKLSELLGEDISNLTNEEIYAKIDAKIAEFKKLGIDIDELAKELVEKGSYISELEAKIELLLAMQNGDSNSNVGGSGSVPDGSITKDFQVNMDDGSVGTYTEVDGSIKLVKTEKYDEFTGTKVVVHYNYGSDGKCVSTTTVITDGKGNQISSITSDYVGDDEDEDIKQPGENPGDGIYDNEGDYPFYN